MPLISLCPLCNSSLHINTYSILSLKNYKFLDCFSCANFSATYNNSSMICFNVFIPSINSCLNFNIIHKIINVKTSSYTFSIPWINPDFSDFSSTLLLINQFILLS